MIRKHGRQWLDDLRQVRTPGSFAQNAAFAFSGTAVVVLSQIILTPFIARIYGPEVYGIYGIFLNLCMNLALVADLGYSNAYVLPRDDQRMEDLVRGNLVLLATVMVLLLPVCLARETVYAWIPSWSNMGLWFYALPLGVAVQVLPVIATHWLLRKKAFGHSSSIGGGSNLVLRLFNLGYGWITRGATHGLILGELLVRGASVGVYWHALRSHGVHRLTGDWHWSRIRAVMREYKSYPLFIFPERWVALLGLQLPIFFLSDDPEVVGQFAMASSLLLLPLRLFGFSMGTVFRQKAAETHREDPTDLARITSRFFQRLMVLGVLPFAAVAVFGDLGFRLLLGAVWTSSGVYAAWLAFFFYYRMLSEPIIGLMNVQRREMHLLLFQSVLTALRLAALGAGLWMMGSSDMAILCYAVVSTLAYVALSGYLMWVAGTRWVRHMVISLLMIVGLAMLFAAARWMIFGNWWPSA